MNIPPTAKNYLLVWGVVFFYAVIAAILVQLVILPYLLPGMHWGHGMLIGLDSPMYHKLAVALSNKIAVEGWGSWELRPDGQAPAGISAIVYVLTLPEPWTLIPLYAAVHATTAVMAVAIIRGFTQAWFVPLIAAAPLVFFPSSLTWVTQPYKDGFTILGTLLVVYSVSQIVAKEVKWKEAAVLTLYFLIGCVFIWVMRPYLTRIVMSPIIALLGPAMIALQQIVLKRSGQPTADFKQVAIKAATIAVMLVAMYSFPNSGGAAKVGVKTATGKCSGVINIRENFIIASPNARSGVDTDLKLESCADIIAYAPRAMIVGLFAPFPPEWFKIGTLPSYTYMIRESAMEMLVVYFALAFLPLFAWRNRMRFDMWFIVAFSVAMLLILTIVIPNLGTLYRMRYGYLLTLVALGLAEAGARLKLKTDR